MNIGLIDADNTKFPNLALMKLSARHKAKGDSVEWVNHWDFYDKVYISKVFTFTPDIDTIILCPEVERGGSGYDLNKKLPNAIEEQFPDYSIYPNVKYAIGFLTRGCSRGCPFCIVKEKEGVTHKVADICDFWNGQKLIKLLDPNLLDWNQSDLLLYSLKLTKAEIDFTQGLDVRLIDNHRIDILKQMKIRRVHFAYDQMKNSERIETNLLNFMGRTGWGRQKVTVYILCNYDTTIEEDLHRIEFVKAAGATPYVMLFDKDKLPAGSIYKRLQRWCNAPQILFSTEWENYQKRNVV